MEIRKIEKFTKKSRIDSSFLSCTQGLQNVLAIRALINEERVEYRFYEVAEYIQLTEYTEKPKFYEVNSKDWLNTIKTQDSVHISELDYRHFVFHVSDYKIEILSEGYIIEKRFIEVYREQELVRKIIKDETSI